MRNCGPVAPMPLRLSSPFLKRLRLEESLRAELERAQDRLPSRVAEEAVAQHAKKYAEMIAGAYAAGFDPAAQEVIWMPKAYLRYRPLSALPLAERVMFRAFAEDLGRGVGPVDGFQDTRDSFEADILNADKAFTHFGIADVASFYRYVPHELLATRIVETTGRADLADAVRGFLRTVMLSDVGVPQNVGSSDQFADIVIAPIERRLIRQGFALSRFNDDFRIGARSNRAVRHGLEALQQELHAIGLTLNDAKTTILRRDTFADHVAQLAGAEYETMSDLGDAPRTKALLRGTTSMLTKALRSPDKTKKSRLQESQAIDQVRRALRRLTRWSDPAALKHGQAIINRHPSLTQHYGRYCARLVDDGRGQEVADYLERVFPRLILTPWQELWLLEPIIAGAPPSGARLSRWVTRCVERRDAPMLRGRAALASAKADLIEAETALGLVDVLPEAARPDAIAAYAHASGQDGDAKRSLAGLPDSLLASWIFDRAM